MQNINLLPALPEAILLLMILVIMMCDAFLGQTRKLNYVLALITSAVVSVLWACNAGDPASHYLFGNMFVADPMSNLLKAFGGLATFVTFIYGQKYLEARGLARGDFYVLSLFSLLGLSVMISGNNFLTLYLGLELMSLSLYALAAVWRDSTNATESAMKYYVLGALASGFLLYGMSMMYGATGSLELAKVFEVIASGAVNKIVLVFGVVFVVAGLAFKLGAAPFHMWVPDVYQGAPTPVTLLIGGAPKLGAFALLLRLLVEGMLPLAIDWQQMLIILAVLSLVIGNLTAIVQTNVKRLLAYSTISHMGFVLLGMLSGVVGGKIDGIADAYGSSLFYSVIYLLTTLGTFGIVLLLSRKGFEAENLTDLKGLNQRSPWFAFVMLMLMFSLAGIPPLAGFYAKLAVLQAVVNAGMVWLAVVAVIASLIGAFYYLRVVKLMYFDKPEDANALEGSGTMRFVLSLNGLVLVYLGLMPGSLMDWCLRTIKLTLAS
ncbi:MULTISPECIES: NADH-quinone oxidoreductase subunit NuoN [Pandoraea]|uniref:NADH-quinone oxidoreductase subunit N n=1 Tax=Pandoraea communis TaxID=2508297 RepID=A0A5E4V766_9BURK|nr:MULTISPECIES: NADH-quinone oxidoreductase subunit NuoN [Pandoraea]EON12165.1 NADH-quinone oxidoreductase subunit N [Pandoraea sp. SD6-2]VVD96276.1 NADH-quinone oxidoreductase subunit N [Pandoraea communis]VVE08162.1 NADH-quinone oxidoreductase subunit N [Pandoraea communis]